MAKSFIAVSGLRVAKRKRHYAHGGGQKGGREGAFGKPFTLREKERERKGDSLVFMAKWAIGQRLNGEYSEGTILMRDGSSLPEERTEA